MLWQYARRNVCLTFLIVACGVLSPLTFFGCSSTHWRSKGDVLDTDKTCTQLLNSGGSLDATSWCQKHDASMAPLVRDIFNHGALHVNAIIEEGNLSYLVAELPDDHEQRRYLLHLADTMMLRPDANLWTPDCDQKYVLFAM